MTVKGVQFVSDSEGRKTGVLIDLREHRQEWEDFYDVMVAESRRSEPRITLEELKRRLRPSRKRRG